MAWTSRWSDQQLDCISAWASLKTRTIQVTEGYGSNPLTLEVNEFVPLQGDMLHRHWVVRGTGVERSALIPPYAIVDMPKAEQAYKDYIYRAGPEFFKSALGDKHNKEQKDKLIWGTYIAAIEAVKNPKTASI